MNHKDAILIAMDPLFIGPKSAEVFITSLLKGISLYCPTFLERFSLGFFVRSPSCLLGNTELTYVKTCLSRLNNQINKNSQTEEISSLQSFFRCRCSLDHYYLFFTKWILSSLLKDPAKNVWKKVLKEFPLIMDFSLIHLPEYCRPWDPPFTLGVLNRTSLIDKILNDKILLVTIHGCAPWVLPTKYEFGKLFPSTLLNKMVIGTLIKRKIASASLFENIHISTVSQSAKKNIMKIFGMPSEKISVIYHGIDLKVFHPIEEREALNATLNRYGLKDESYFFHISSYTPRKNIEGIIMAFGRLLKNENFPARKKILLW